MKAAMTEVEEMQNDEIEEMMRRVHYGHFACARNDQPYVVPIHFAYDTPNIYFYTTEGKKTEIMRINPRVCLQVEEVVDNGNWRSVIVQGDAEQIVDGNEREKIIKMILASNPTLTPAISIRWMDNWVRENVEAVYRIKPTMVTGRSSVNVKTQVAVAQPGDKSKSRIH